MDDERMSLLALSQIPGLGNKAKKAILSHFKKAARVFSCSESVIKGLFFLNDKEKEALINGRKEPVAELLLESLKYYGISFVTVNEMDYPRLLHDVFNPPFIIFYRGTLPHEDESCVAMVGRGAALPTGRKRRQNYPHFLQKTTSVL